MPKKRKIRGENPKRQKQKQNNTKEEVCTEEKQNMVDKREMIPKTKWA
jgi:hypothetical protein